MEQHIDNVNTATMLSKLNIACTHNSLWLVLDSRQIGGIENHVFTLAEALQKQGLHPTVVLMDDYGSSPNINRLKRLNIPYYICHGSRDFIRNMRKNRPALLHSHGYKAGIICRVFGYLSGIKVISTYHSGDIGTGRLRFYTMLDLLTAYLAPRIAVSQSIAQRLYKPVTVIPNFVNMPTKLNINQHTRIGFVGRLSYEKGPDIFCQLAKDHPYAEFHLYGDGPMRTELQAQYDDQVIFHGFCTDMAQIWPDIDLLCITSRAEGLPLAALEALAHGIPVCTFNIGGLGDLIRDNYNGWLIPAENIPKMNQAIAHWLTLDDTTRTQLQQCAQELIANQYTPEAVVPQIIAQYALALSI
ncbi:MAG: glycosyltransferase family 4 protein [Plesiomonas sp.]|uniref:glycosyltransferase family 4 protein n=1 Tax=Plesiomonas sp. TaxID=2486279 RepID=UPI003F320FFA